VAKRKRPDEWVRLDEAYDALTREAYAVWVRMMLVPSSSLEGAGLAGLARVFRYKERGFREVLRELRNKGYLRVVTPPRPGQKAAIEIVKKPVLVGADRFVRF